MIAYLLHRRSEAGLFDALTPSCARDQAHLNIWTAKAKRRTQKGTGNADLDDFNSWAGKS